MGFVSRRLGFDYETGYSLANTQTQQATEAVTEFVWTSVGGDGTISFLVQQVGGTIYFYDLSSTINLSAHKKSFTITLSSYVPSGSSRDPSIYPCQYASGRGQLSVVNRAIQPLYIIYTAANDSITVTAYEIQVRDFTGLPDTLTVAQRPTVNPSALIASNPAHYYNLLNQGWSENDGSALSAWQTARSGSQHDSPSNADYVALYRSSPTVNFDNNRVINQDPLTSPAAKGHYILNACNPNRTSAMANDSSGPFTVNLTNPALAINQSLGPIISLNYGNVLNGGPPSTAFQGNLSETQASNLFTATGAVGGTNYIGKNYTGIPQQINQVTLYGTTTNGYSFNSAGGSEPTVTWYLQASQSAPISPTSGTALGSVSFTNIADESGGRTITSSDTTTFWNYVWVYGTLSSGAILMLVNLQFFTNGPSTGYVIPNTTERAQTCCFFAGRLFYASINALSLNNTIFFTQIITVESQYGQCYQVNDPTSENVFDLLPSDGGTIVIPEAATIRKLFAYQNALLVFASNGVWMVTGGSSGGFGGGFTANDYFVKKLSSVGMNSPLSVADRRGVPMWFGEDGVYTINYNAQFNSFEVVNVTFKTIRTFYLNIPYNNQQYVKSAYDPVYDVVYWVYNANASPTIPYSYTNVLLFNGLIAAFYPWTISNTLSTDPQVRGVAAVRDAQENNLTHIKFFTTALSGSTETMVYSEQINTSYQDWTTATLNYNYNSYLKTNYKLNTEGQRFSQMRYVWIFLENIANSSLYVQGLFDFANNTNSGKWSTPQQCYNSNTTMMSNHAVDFRRLKLRGKGRSLQLQFLSDTNKPFQIQGWSVDDVMTMGA